jgi:hypothetical protein
MQCILYFDLGDSYIIINIFPPYTIDCLFSALTFNILVIFCSACYIRLSIILRRGGGDNLSQRGLNYPRILYPGGIKYPSIF